MNFRVLRDEGDTVIVGWDPGAPAYRITGEGSGRWSLAGPNIQRAKDLPACNTRIKKAASYTLVPLVEGESYRIPAAQPAPSSLGCPWNATGLANLEIGKTGRDVAMRFRAERTGRIVGCRVYLKHGSGYSAGTGGKIRCDLYTADTDGHPATLVAQSNVVTDPLTESFRTFELDADVAGGKRYCLVFVNVDAGQAANYVSLNSMNHPPLTPRQPEIADADLAVLYRDGGRAWGGDHPERTPIFEVAYADGGTQGQRYVDFMPSQRITLGTVTQTLTGPGSFSRVRAWVGGTGTVTFALAGKTATATKTGSGQEWVEAPLAVDLDDKPHTVTVTGQGVTIFPYQKGTGYGFSDPQPEGHGPDAKTDWPVYLDTEATPAPPSPPPPHQEGEIPAFAVRLTPNWVSSQDGADAPTKNYNALWVYPKSPTTPYRSPDAHKQVSRYLLLDPRYKCADGHQGRDEWWFLIERYWPASFNPSQHGKWGREVNFHNVAGDAGPSGSGGVGWGFGTGVSSLALDWLSAAPSPILSVLGAYHSEGGFEVPLPAARDEWHTYLVHWIAGRTDGTTVRPGALTVWADGDKLVDRTGLNTVQRAKGPDGNYYVQRWMTLWEGDYTSFLPAPSEKRLALTRIGATLAECLADRPVSAGDNAATMYYRGAGTNLGPPTLTRLPDRDPSAARIP